MKSKIIFSTYDNIKNPYYNGGGAFAIHEVARRLTATFDVTILTSKYPHYRDATHSGVKYIHIGWPYPNPRLAQIIFLLCLPSQVMVQKFDVWFENFTPPIGSMALNLFTFKPVVSLIHMLPAVDMQRKYLLPFKILENIMVKLQKYFIVLSNQTYKDIKTINPHAEIEIIPNGIILPEKIKKRTKLKHILSIGRLEINQKGIDLLLKAYKKLLPKKPPPLIIAGNGSSAQNAALKKLVLRLHLQKYVHLIGRVEGTKKDQLFRESYCIVLPSRFETFSLTALESIAHGKPLVCFDIPGLRWIPDHLCLKVNKFNIDQLQNSIHKAYSDKKFKQTLAVNAPIFIKHFEWRTIALRYQKVIFHHLGYEQTHPLDYTK